MWQPCEGAEREPGQQNDVFHKLVTAQASVKETLPKRRVAEPNAQVPSMLTTYCDRGFGHKEIHQSAFLEENRRRA
jgi:hypothetical protein